PAGRAPAVDATETHGRTPSETRVILRSLPSRAAFRGPAVYDRNVLLSGLRRRLRSLLGRSRGDKTLPAPRERDRNGNREGSPDRVRALSGMEPDAGHDIERRGASTRTPPAQRLNDVAVPRVVVFTVDAHASAGEAVRQLVQAGCRRAPLVLRDLDRPVGVIDLLDVMREGDRSVLHVARPALILSPDMEVADALREMRRRDAPMALVGDRYRGVTGIVTEKHLLERSAPASIRS